ARATAVGATVQSRPSDPPTATATPSAPPSSQSSNPGTAVPRTGAQRLSPAVRRLAAENRLDLSAISGSGRNGRITRRDVIDFIAAREARPAAVGTATTAAASGAAV